MTQKKTVAEVRSAVEYSLLADSIAGMWNSWSESRRPWLEQQLELRNYLFATDTSTTTNSTLPWKNSTTRPKLTQIRDNLHANYQSALFPNDNWMDWEGANDGSVTEEKQKAIRAYMQNKVREGGFMLTISDLLLDYIDTGNAFYDTVFVNESHTDPDTGELIPGYIGPKIVRTSYRDICFDPRAATFDGAPKITRYLKTFGQLAQEIEDYPDMGYNADILEKMRKLRYDGYGVNTPEDYNLLTAYQVDGFGSFYEYLKSGTVEILVFEGSIWDEDNQKLHKNQVIHVVDRCWVAKVEPMPSWLGKSSKGHTGWRKRPDNLYAMGPLHNLVGMQYRIDHLENAKADALDLSIHPPLVISGNVEMDEGWAPGAQWYAGEGAAVTELGKNLSGAITAENQIAELERQMEEYAGAPKEAMGIRTPGEKTAFEVQTLEMAASRIFQQKIRQFELEVVEPALNRMLELARRNMSGSDLVRVMDDDLGVVNFLTVTKEDITASGKLRAVGARHFAERATMLQNILGVANSALGQDPGIRPHWSGKELAKLILWLTGLDSTKIYGENIQIIESLQTEHLKAEAVNQLQETSMTPLEAPQPLPEGGASGPVQ